ncbi:putative porin [Selenomonas sp. AE3005]|uniref:putative porin n=1 Tax=Selenomonas sp. AE3005 TaxID=1485543 RepID=UPI0025F7A75F|nr:putative porin [Selenomonas sp. AE3005]
MKKTLVSALTTALVVGAASTTFAAANPFSDVPADHWAYDAVSQLAADGVIDGYGDSTFKGNRNITRYEMAQMVAKAMAKNTSGVDKALVDKLAAEFAAELNNLGVRVANLERNADMVKWNGEARYTFARTSVEDGDDSSTNQFRLRLEPSAEVNSNWHVKARLDADVNSKKDSGDGNANDGDKVTLKRIWAQGDYKNFTVKLGKFGGMNNDSFADVDYSGAEVTFGKNVKGIIGAGRLNRKSYGDNTAVIDAANYQYVGVEGQKKKFSGGLYWHHLNRGNLAGELNAAYGNAEVATPYSEDGEKSEFNLIAAKAAYRFNKSIAMNGFYATNRNADNYNRAWGVEADYKGAQKENKGTWGAWVAYRHVGAFGVINPTWDVVKRNQKGWEIGGNYTIFKNIVATLRYGHNKDIATDNTVNTYFGRVQFFF